MILLYDGECPICQRYQEYVAARQTYNLQVYDAREHGPLVQRLKEQGYDINEGMILLINEQIFHQDAALVMVASMLKGKGLGDYLLRKMMTSPRLMKFLYPLFFGLRILLLKWKGKGTQI